MRIIEVLKLIKGKIFSNMSEIENSCGRQIFTNRELMGKNIYCPAYTRTCDWATKMKYIHHNYKYKFLIPVLALGDLILGKFKDTKPRDTDYYRELQVFDRVWDKTDYWWYKNYIHYNKGLSDKKLKKLYKSHKFNKMKIIKEHLITLLGNDTAYYEFFVKFSHEYVKALNKEFEGEKINHLIYTSKQINDANWFVMDRMMQDNNLVQTVRNVEDNVENTNI